MGVALFRQHADRLDARERRTVRAATETLSNSIEATAWLRSPVTTAVNATSAFTGAPSLLDQDGIVHTRERLDEIENRRRALLLNQQEFAPIRRGCAPTGRRSRPTAPGGARH